jgi:lipid A 4'-phosphatase
MKNKFFSNIPWISIASFIFFAILFIIFPSIDIWFSNLFFMKNKFIFSKNKIIRIIDYVVEYGGIALWVGFVAYLGLKDLKRNGLRDIFKPGIKRKLLYISLVGLIGSVGLVHGIKMYMRRCRPNLVEFFGGIEKFTKVFTQNTAPIYEKCVSFVSGHSAVGFLIFSIAFLYSTSDIRRKRYILIGMLVGTLFGIVRIVQGKHFISDVIFSGYVVYFTALVLSLVIKPSAKEEDL